MLSQDLNQINSWQFKEARKIIKKLQAENRNKAILSTGYGPSGQPHIGTYTEIFRTAMIQKVLYIYGIESEIICVCDDLDALRKVPRKMPKQEIMHQYIGQPLSKIPDPYGQSRSLASTHAKMLKDFLLNFNIDNYKIVSATELYEEGFFDECLIEILYNHENVCRIVQESVGDERKKNYSPFLPICPDTGKVLQVPITQVNLQNNSIVYEYMGKTYEVPVTGGKCKLQWKVDWAMRWKAMNVDYEMYGKDLIDSHVVAKKLSNLFKYPTPLGMHYELFLDEKGKKISKSKGNNEFTVEDWIKYSFSGLLIYFVARNPQIPAKFSYNELIRSFDNYLRENQKTIKADSHVKYVQLFTQMHPFIDISFSMLMQLARFLCNANKIVEKLCLNKDYDIAQKEYLKLLAKYAIALHQDYFQQENEPLQLSEKALEAVQCMKKNLLVIENDEATITAMVYEVGKKFYGKEELLQWFTTLYRVFFFSEKGPRIGSFIYLYGIKDSIDLIDKNCGRGEMVDAQH